MLTVIIVPTSCEQTSYRSSADDLCPRDNDESWRTRDFLFTFSLCYLDDLLVIWLDGWYGAGGRGGVGWPPRLSLDIRMSSKQSNFFFGVEPKQTETQSVSVVFRFVSRNQKKCFRFVSVWFGVSDLYRNNRNKQNFVKTNRNQQPKKSPKNVLY
jgi:hypothetical protein